MRYLLVTDQLRGEFPLVEGEQGGVQCWEVKLGSRLRVPVAVRRNGVTSLPDRPRELEG